MSRITTDEYQVATPCGQKRFFKASNTATKWFKVHQKVCSLCKDSTVCSAEMEHRVRYDNKTSMETAETLKYEYIKDHLSIFDV
jgi:hypothetical protein